MPTRHYFVLVIWFPHGIRIKDYNIDFASSSTSSSQIFNFYVGAVRRCARRLGFREVKEDEEWCLMWMDTACQLDHVINMKKYQVSAHLV